MSLNVFFTADTHFNHAKVIQFEPSLRPFKTIEEHDEELIKRWNDRVRPKDIVWHLGDVWLGKHSDAFHFHSIMHRLNGIKYLVRGNHDTLPLDLYHTAFKEIYGVHEKYGFVMSHVPLHPNSVDRWGLNVHGHLHSQKVQQFDGDHYGMRDDPRYFCVSVEQHNLAPISLDELRKAAGQ